MATDSGYVNFVNSLKIGDVIEIGIVDHLNLRDLIQTDKSPSYHIDHWAVGRLISFFGSLHQFEILFFNGEIVTDMSAEVRPQNGNNVARLGTHVHLTRELIDHIAVISKTDTEVAVRKLFVMHNFLE